MKRKWKKHGWYAGLVLFLLISFAGCERGIGKEAWTKETRTEILTEESFSSGTAGEPAEEDPEEKPESILVYVCGEVAVPGVYTLEAGSRVCDAVAAAGGMTENAAADYLNLAQVVRDGEKIRVPDLEAAAAGQADGPEETKSGLIDLNTADVSQLMTLPGIGKAKAEAILAYREDNGPFSSTEEIKRVSGIGDATYERLKEFITV